MIQKRKNFSVVSGLVALLLLSSPVLAKRENPNTSSVNSYSTLDTVVENNEAEKSSNEYTPWLSLPSSAPVGVIPWDDYPIAHSDSLEHPSYPDTLISGGDIVLGSPGQQTRGVWSAPLGGSPVDHYVLELSFCIDCMDGPNEITTKIRVAGVDAQQRQGEWSQASEPGIIYLPPPPEGMGYAVDDSTGTLKVLENYQNSEIPRRGFIAQNYPNPFNGTTSFRYRIPEGSRKASDINIHDSRGRLVHMIYTNKSIGEHEVVFDVNDVDGLASGIYFALMSVDGSPSPLKFTYLK